MTIKLRGAFTALITPFKGKSVDYETFEKLVERQINAGISGLIPCGSCGESATLSHAEHQELVRLCVKQSNGRVPVFAGTGSNSTEEAISLSEHAEKVGASGVMVVAPYYNKPTQEGLYQHYKAISEAIGIPMILYNAPGRSIVNISDETIIRLTEQKNIIGMKDATGDLERPLKLGSMLKREFFQLAGDDAFALAFNAQGGVGCISTASNIVPEFIVSVQNLWQQGKLSEALDLQKKLMPLYNLLFIETNPIPVKFAANLLGLCESTVRLPLTPLSEQFHKPLTDCMKNLGIL